MANAHYGITPEIGQYLDQLLPEATEVTRRMEQYILEEGLDPIHLHPAQSHFLKSLIRLSRAKNILEIGTHIGCSAVSMAEVIGNNGSIRTLEILPDIADIARHWIHDQLKLKNVEVITADALEYLSSVPGSTYDLVFIDCEKICYPKLVDSCVRVLVKNGILLADNTLHKGRIATDTDRPDTNALKDYNQQVFNHHELESNLIPIGDGFTLSVKVSGHE